MSKKEFILKFYEEVFNGHDLSKAKDYLHNKVMVYHKNVNLDGSVNANVVDIYRLEDGKCKEHWDVLQRF